MGGGRQGKSRRDPGVRKDMLWGGRESVSNKARGLCENASIVWAAEKRCLLNSERVRDVLMYSFVCSLSSLYREPRVTKMH